eukprot:TRINITY_DN24009_c2_g1_i1.p1 TRINITY_DN24009_c2_g1~~TRINITY_DN24009_c2_g1_i1.p1  ORF type:complete len:791 (+),score=60.54 TRINITY_DN24009_c2_g1_i1:145-2517(+)
MLLAMRVVAYRVYFVHVALDLLLYAECITSGESVNGITRWNSHDVSRPTSFLGHDGPSLSVEARCSKEAAVERALDAFAYASLSKPSWTGSLDLASVYDTVNVLNAKPNRLFASSANAVAARLQNWKHALDRVYGNSTSFTPNVSLRSSPAAANEITLGLGQPSSHAKHALNHSVPPICPDAVPADDPYWSLADSYWVKDSNGQAMAYNACQYSQGCSKEFTNAERLASIRATLATTHAFFAQRQVQYMLFGGSAIGAKRCQDVLPWDLDADVVVAQENVSALLKMLDGAPYGTGFGSLPHTRSVDLAVYGFPGFVMMDKISGCLPFVIVDASTGFFVDVFPMSHINQTIYSPWWSSEKPCDTHALFNGCDSGKCDTWSFNSTFPTASCTMGNVSVACAHDADGFLREYYGSGIDTPDRPTRGEVSLVHVESILLSHGNKYGLLVALVFVLPAALWMFGAPRVLSVFTLYMGLYMAWAMLTYATRDEKYNSAMFVLNASLMKLLVSFVLWRLWEGSSILEFPSIAWKARATLLQYCVPAGLYALSDVIRVDALRATDASTFAILFNSRMLFLAFVWQQFMNRKLHLVHWASLMAVLMGCVFKELPHVNLGADGSSGDRYWAYLEIGLLGVLTSFATVWNEFLLQTDAHVGVSLQNLAMYVWGSFWSLIVTLVWAFVGGESHVSPLDLAAWTSIWGNPLVLTGVVILALYGIGTGYFLRHLSNITREVVLGALAPLLSVAMDVWLFKLTLTWLEHAGLVLVLSGIILFSFRPVLAIDSLPVASEDIKSSAN